MKFSIFNLLTTITIIALAIALATNLRRERTVEVAGYDFFESWEILNSEAVRSSWKDRSLPPNILPNLVFGIAQEFAGELNRNRQQIGTEWIFESMTLVPIDSQWIDGEVGDEWVYLVVLTGHKYPIEPGVGPVEHLRFLVLMDGTTIFHPGQNSREVVSIVEQFGSKNAARWQLAK